MEFALSNSLHGKTVSPVGSLITGIKYSFKLRTQKPRTSAAESFFGAESSNHVLLVYCSFTCSYYNICNLHSYWARTDCCQSIHIFGALQCDSFSVKHFP